MKIYDKIFRVLLGVLFCIAVIFCVYIAYLDSQSRNIDEWVIIPLIFGAIELFIAAFLLIRDQSFEHSSVQFIARLIGAFCIVAGIFLTICFIFYLIVGNDYSRQWTLSVALGILSCMQFGAYFIIIRRVRRVSKGNETNTNHQEFPGS
jgi:hypothetical protein